ncbi:hypothetical protein ACVWW6_003370 [Bradyrhizobium sp. USDA 3311]
MSVRSDPSPYLNGKKVAFTLVRRAMMRLRQRSSRSYVPLNSDTNSPDSTS